jgi:hypothetical protein
MENRLSLFAFLFLVLCNVGSARAQPRELLTDPIHTDAGYYYCVTT